MMTSDQFSRGPGKGVKKLDKKLWGGKLNSGNSVKLAMKSHQK